MFFFSQTTFWSVHPCKRRAERLKILETKITHEKIEIFRASWLFDRILPYYDREKKDDFTFELLIRSTSSFIDFPSLLNDIVIICKNRLHFPSIILRSSEFSIR